MYFFSSLFLNQINHLTMCVCVAIVYCITVQGCIVLVVPTENPVFYSINTTLQHIWIVPAYAVTCCHILYNHIVYLCSGWIGIPVALVDLGALPLMYPIKKQRGNDMNISRVSTRSHARNEGYQAMHEMSVQAHRLYNSWLSLLALLCCEANLRKRNLWMDVDR